MSSVNSCKTYNRCGSALRNTSQNPMRGSSFQIITFIRLLPRRKRQNCCCSEKRHSPQPCRPASLVSIEATGVCIPIGNSEVLLAAVCKSPGHAWNDADITELLNFRHMSLLAQDLNAKYPFLNSVVSNPSGEPTAYK
jgi:hypothetical protein